MWHMVWCPSKKALSRVPEGTTKIRHPSISPARAVGTVETASKPHPNTMARTLQQFKREYTPPHAQGPLFRRRGLPLARAVGPSRESFLALPWPRPAPALPFFCVRSPFPLSAGLSSCGSSELARSPSCTASQVWQMPVFAPTHIPIGIRMHARAPQGTPGHQFQLTGLQPFFQA